MSAMQIREVAPLVKTMERDLQCDKAGMPKAAAEHVKGRTYTVLDQKDRAFWEMIESLVDAI